MLDAFLRRQIEPLFARPAARVAGYGISADSLTLSSFVLGIAALPDIGHRSYMIGLGLITLGRMFDVADGAIARVRGATRFGAYLEQVLDLIWTATVPFAFALAQPDRALAAMFLLLGLTARAAVLTADSGGVAGLRSPLLEIGANFVGKVETFAAFALACIFPGWFSLIAYILGILCFVMAGFRVAAVAARRS